jgi:hypothetical protein
VPKQRFGLVQEQQSWIVTGFGAQDDGVEGGRRGEASWRKRENKMGRASAQQQREEEEEEEEEEEKEGIDKPACGANAVLCAPSRTGPGPGTSEVRVGQVGNLVPRHCRSKAGLLVVRSVGPEAE